MEPDKAMLTLDCECACGRRWRERMHWYWWYLAKFRIMWSSEWFRCPSTCTGHAVRIEEARW